MRHPSSRSPALKATSRFASEQATARRFRSLSFRNATIGIPLQRREATSQLQFGGMPTFSSCVAVQRWCMSTCGTSKRTENFGGASSCGAASRIFSSGTPSAATARTAENDQPPVSAQRISTGPTPSPSTVSPYSAAPVTPAVSSANPVISCLVMSLFSVCCRSRDYTKFPHLNLFTCFSYFARSMYLDLCAEKLHSPGRASFFQSIAGPL